MRFYTLQTNLTLKMKMAAAEKEVVRYSLDYETISPMVHGTVFMRTRLKITDL